MPDYSAMPRGVDLSHYQRRPDFGRLVEDGIAFVYIKAAEHLTVDPDWEWNRDEAFRRGLPFLAYAFLRPGDGAATIGHFLDVSEGAAPVLDWEIAGVSTAALERDMQICEDRLGRVGMAYYGLYPPDRPSAAIARWPRILPQYPASASAATRLPPHDGSGDLRSGAVDWRAFWLINQYSGHGHLAGVAGEIDLNRAACPIDVLAQWIATGELRNWTSLLRPPAPAPREPTPVLGSRVLRRHAIGADVRELQQRLGRKADGEFGPETEAAVELFQRAHGLMVDGVVGPATAAAIKAA